MKMMGLIRRTGDTKAGTLIGKDAWGNKYYENLEEELPRKLCQKISTKPTYSPASSANKMGGLQRLRARAVRNTL